MVTHGDRSIAATQTSTPTKSKRSKIAVVSLVIACIAGEGVFFAMKKTDPHYAETRRLWAEHAIASITNDLKDSAYLRERFGEAPKPMGEFDTSEPEWKTADIIVCRDSSWLAYRAQCHKQDPKVHDIFIAKASDGRWYYSDYHFCIGMMMLEFQPRSLEQFKDHYFLVEFDGTSGKALDPTWIPIGERRDLDDEEMPPD